MSERSGLPYADTIGGCSPMTVQIIARRLGGDIVEGELGAMTHEIGLPGYFGPPTLMVNRKSRGSLRWLAYAHGLAHLAAGELDPLPDAQIKFMSDRFDYMTLSERRADLFALANTLDDPRLPRSELEVRQLIHVMAPDWPLDRVRDRARLRLLLYERRHLCGGD